MWLARVHFASRECLSCVLAALASCARQRWRPKRVCFLMICWEGVKRMWVASNACSSLSEPRLYTCINEVVIHWSHGSAGAEFMLVDGARLKPTVTRVPHIGQLIDGIADSRPSV